MQHQEARGRFQSLMRAGPVFWARLQQYMARTNKKVFSRSIILAGVKELQLCKTGPNMCWVNLPPTRPADHELTQATLIKITPTSTAIPRTAG